MKLEFWKETDEIISTAEWGMEFGGILPSCFSENISHKKYTRLHNEYPPNHMSLIETEQLQSAANFLWWPVSWSIKLEVIEKSDSPSSNILHVEIIVDVPQEFVWRSEKSCRGWQHEVS
jgi:hypothetical protein